ncbi:MAG: hypothetical protein H6710_14650 [Myxococcales bacterium]|nr:hypothetical protein [Myxococcales bacterium]
MLRATTLPTVIALLAAGCADADADDGGELAGSTTSIVDLAAFVPLDPADDPFAARRGPDATCDPAGFGIEDLAGEPAFEIASGLCGYLSAGQPLPFALPAGALLKIRLWHFDLSASGPADAFLALAIDGAPLWSKTVAIPAPGALVLEELTLGEAAAAGAPLVFHVDNHGENTYALLEISATW